MHKKNEKKFIFFHMRAHKCLRAWFVIAMREARG